MTLALILDLLTAAIVGLDATPYAQPLGTAVSWAESAQVLDPMMMPAQAGHLAFSLLVRGRPTANMERDAIGGVTRVRTNLEVAFCFRLRPDCQTDDYRLAWTAARDIAACINAESTWASGEAGEGDLVALVTDLGTPRMVLTGGVLLITVAASIYHSEDY